jgi:hypothetical protein
VEVGGGVGVTNGVGVRVGGYHCVGVGGSVRVGSRDSGVGVAEGTWVGMAVGVGVGVLGAGRRASIEMPIQ